MTNPEVLDASTIQIIARCNPGDVAIYQIADGKLLALYYAKSLPEMSGMDPDEYAEAIRQDAAALIRESDRGAVAARLDAMLRTGRDGDFTYRVFHKTYGHIWIHACGRIIGSLDGYPVLMVSYSRTSAESVGHAQLLDLSSAIQYVVDRDSYELLFANKTAVRCSGRGNAEGRRCYEYVNGRSEPCPWCSIPQMRNGIFHTDAAYAPQQKRWLSIDCRDIDWYGRKAVAVYAADVTEQQQRQQSIEADRNNLDALLGKIPGGVAVFSDRNGALRLEYTNDGFYSLHHGSREYWSSQSSNPADWLTPDDRHIFDDEFRAVKSGEKEFGSVTYRILGEDGGLYWVCNQFRRAYERDGISYYYASFTDMDEQIAAEAARAEARKMYEAAVEDAKLVVWKYDIPGHRITMAENEFTEYDYRKFGLPKVIENAPQSLVPYIDDAYAEPFLEMYRQIESGAPTASCEVWYKLKPGQAPRFERISYTTIFDFSGKPVVAYGIGQNLTAQKSEEERYKQARMQLETAHPATLGSFHLNLTKNWCGEGKSPLEFVLKQQESGTVDGYFAEFSKLIADDDVKQRFFALFSREKLLEEFKKGRTNVSIQYPILYRDGSRHWRDGQLYMLQNPTTDDIEAVTFAIDIDDEKKNELITKKLTGENFDYIGLINPTTEKIEIRAARTETIIPSEERQSYPYDKAAAAVAQLVAPEEREQYAAAVSLKSVLQALRAAGRYSFSYKRTAAGRTLLKSVSYTWLEKPESTILIVSSDITAANEHEQDLLRQSRAALLEANRANESKSMFLSSVSHDLRTPLNGIIGFTDIAIRETDAAKKQEYLLKIKTSSDLLLSLVNDTLELSRIESGKYTLEPEAVDSRAFGENVMTAMRPSAEIKGIRLEADLSRLPAGNVWIDKLKVQKILLNLLSNAIKFTPAGGTVRVSIARLEPPEAGNNYRIIVEDTGIGISPDFIQHLFEPFAQEHRQTAGSAVGTGLGLSIVKRIVDLMGGTIQVQSTIGSGSRFTVDLPLQPADAA